MDGNNNVPLREYIETRIADLEKHMNTRFDFIDKQTKDAKETIDRRLESMNEIREQLATQVPLGEFNLKMKSIDEDIRSLRDSRAVLEGKADQKSVNNAQIMASVAIFIALLGVILMIIK